MRHIIFLLTISLFLISCSQNDNKQKELELKERELALKEKEMELNERELKDKKSDSNKTKAIDNTNNAEFPVPTGYCRFLTMLTHHSCMLTHPPKKGFCGFVQAIFLHVDPLR